MGTATMEIHNYYHENILEIVLRITQVSFVALPLIHYAYSTSNTPEPDGFISREGNDVVGRAEG